MGGRILLVDDNEDFLDSTRDVLVAEGYTVTTAANGKDALSLTIENQFDLVLMDIKMPGINGVESFIQMKARRPDIRVILFTAHSVDSLIHKAREAGVYEVLSKPIDLVRLLALMDQAQKTGNGGCILVADDDMALCDNLLEILGQAGYKVAVACDSSEAIEKADETPFDVILLDMKLPGMNGLEVYRKVKKLQPDVVTILITGYGEEMQELVEQTLTENAFICLNKPLDMEQLLVLLKKIYEARERGTLKKTQFQE